MKNNPMKSKIKLRILFNWVTTIISAVAFVIPGIGNLIHLQHFVTDMAHLGYPGYFLTLFGFWKILGATAIVVPGFKRLKEWAYAGMAFDLTGAAYSRISGHDMLVMTLVPILILCIVVASWSLRPENRKL
jgi:uncharacterized membrane protein YphA (DoxX/SURF4 family)